jgi:NADH-quinone oxidoreductase subunit J
VAAVVFFLAATLAIAGAIGVLAARNPFYSVLALVIHLLALAMLFLLLRAEFVAAAQVIVYAGAVMVLYVFVVAYVGGQDEPLGQRGSPLRLAAIVAAGGLAVELFIAVLGSGLKGINSRGAPYERGFGSPGAVGQQLLTKFLLPFEVASLLLLVAAVGAVMLARRRRGLDGGIDVPARVELRLPAWAGTMAEGVGGRYQAELPAVGATGEPAEPAVIEPAREPARARRDRGGW